MQICLHFGNTEVNFVYNNFTASESESSETASKHGIQTAVTLNANKIEQVNIDERNFLKVSELLLSPIVVLELSL